MTNIYSIHRKSNTQSIKDVYSKPITGQTFNAKNDKADLFNRHLNQKSKSNSTREKTQGAEPKAIKSEKDTSKSNFKGFETIKIQTNRYPEKKSDINSDKDKNFKNIANDLDERLLKEHPSIKRLDKDEIKSGLGFDIYYNHEGYKLLNSINPANHSRPSIRSIEINGFDQFLDFFKKISNFENNRNQEKWFISLTIKNLSTIDLSLEKLSSNQWLINLVIGKQGLAKNNNDKNAYSIYKRELLEKLTNQGYRITESAEDHCFSITPHLGQV